MLNSFRFYWRQAPIRVIFTVIVALALLVGAAFAASTRQDSHGVDTTTDVASIDSGKILRSYQSENECNAKANYYNDQGGYHMNVYCLYNFEKDNGIWFLMEQ
ncbi:hypothetical protein D8M27_09925 [Corynebacterium pseudodiphtheriticum]|nr:hypothetical protein D8M37_09915 [Corynebacterium pseudodiphtheriticum]RUP93301.1 hypothetical protein D8M27_09925 [Corynebacterium pseudodiphtheriticum]RUP98250.1 hypothetical protein D8M32_09425 [Corynebacterium pseudodiphtheriticum]RUQ47101.1 hypothetical protein D8M30_09720 [Corynebacterium pseudodiphtheriticum]